MTQICQSSHCELMKRHGTVDVENPHCIIFSTQRWTADQRTRREATINISSCSVFFIDWLLISGHESDLNELIKRSKLILQDFGWSGHCQRPPVLAFFTFYIEAFRCKRGSWRQWLMMLNLYSQCYRSKEFFSKKRYQYNLIIKPCFVWFPLAKLNNLERASYNCPTFPELLIDALIKGTDSRCTRS